MAALYEQAAEGESPTTVGSVPENLPDEVPDIEDPEDVVPVPEAGDIEENASIEEPTADAPAEEASSEEVAGETSDDDETENRE